MIKIHTIISTNTAAIVLAAVALAFEIASAANIATDAAGSPLLTCSRRS